MKKPKSKGSGIKHQKKKASARYQTKWVKEGVRGKNQALIVRKNDPPDKIESPLKESTIAMKGVFNNYLDDVGTPKAVVDERIKAEVINIMDAPKLQQTIKPDKPTRAELKDQIDRLEAHMSAIKPEESAFTEPPKLPDLSVNAANTEATPVGKGVHDVSQGALESVEVYGTRIVDTGKGMTPSGQPIQSFLDGTWKPTSWVVQPEPVLHSVTSDDYTYEELAELYDLLQVEMMEQKAHYQTRIGMLNDHINELGRALVEYQRADSVNQYLDVHKGEDHAAMLNRIMIQKETIKTMEDELFKVRSELRSLKTSPNYEVATIELQEENAYLDKENSELRQEVEDLMYTVDQLSREYKSTKCKPPLEVLARNFVLYKKLHEDDPIKNFLRYGKEADLSYAPLLRSYFDQQQLAREIISNERKVYAKWHCRYVPHVRHTYSERLALRSIGKKHRMLHGVTIKPKTREEAIAYLRTVTDNLQLRWDVQQNAKHKAEQLAKEVSVIKDWGARTTTSSSRMTTRLARQEVRMWWLSNITEAEVTKRCAAIDQKHREEVLAAVSQSKLYKPAKLLVKGAKFISDVLNYELSPTARKLEGDAMRHHLEYLERKEKLKQQSLANKRKAKKAEASRIKRMLEEAEEKRIADEINNRIKLAQRLAY